MGDKIKLVYIFGSLGPGGAETVVRNQALNLDKERFEVSFAITGRSEKTVNAEALEQAGIKIVYFGRTPPCSLAFLPFNHIVQKLFRFPQIQVKLWLRRREMLRYFLCEQPDIIHLHLTTKTLNRRQYRYLQKRIGVKYCYTCHSTVDTMFPNYSEKAYGRYLVDECGMKLVALHKEMEQELRATFCTNNTAVVCNGININRFRAAQDARERVRDELGISQDAWVVGHVGRFAPVKNHRFILKIFGEVFQQKPNSWLLLVGDGDLKPEIEAKIQASAFSDRVTILPASGRVPELMAAMDVFLFPSVFEGFGNVLTEAQASELPCVISDSVPKETCLSKEAQYLSLDKTPIEWAEALFALRGKRNVPLEKLDEFDIKNTTQKLEAVYEDMMG